MEEKYFVYFLKSLRNQKVYVGMTNKEPEVRAQEHNNGANEWTRNNKPFKLIYHETYLCKHDAQARERFYKTGFGKKIKKAIVSVLE